MHPHIIALVVLIVTSIAAVREYRVRPDGFVHVDILDVGQGDSMLITGPTGKQVVIDGGPDDSALAELAERMSFFDRSIDLVILSHPDLDHVAAIPDILERYRIGAVIFTGLNHSNTPYKQMLDLLREKQIPVIVADPSKDIDLGEGLILDLLWPPPIYAGVERDDGNNTSIVLRLTYGEDSILFTGDMEEKEEREMLAAGIDVTADILKVAHHGSKTSTSTGFLLAVDPELAVISAGRDNRFGHPHAVVLDRLRHFMIPVRITAQEGAIELILDGR